MPTRTADDLLPHIASGAQVLVRDEEWLVRAVQHTPSDGLMVRCIGTSSFVRDAEATFFTKLDSVEPLRPEETRLVDDDSPNFRRSRLYLEAILRKTPVPSSDTELAVASRQLLDRLEYQRRAVHKALDNLQPRVLIADAVGLGKTLEVGLLLSELIRRGRGERILVVTPRHILEQFQHELWTRFAIPLVRLDSEGIQRVRRKIPANRNPFAHYRRAIISIDTLKNAGRYRHHLEGIHWDAVVIDECHNLVNRGTLNNQLARVLAPRTEALILTSATPHNGDPESFAELIRLLDPTAIVDPKNIQPGDIEHLYIRRHKAHEEVSAEVGHQWADRLPPRPIPVTPDRAESAMFAELSDTWIHPDGPAPVTGKGSSLFPWTLFKAALSSHKALAETIRNRRRNLHNSNGELKDPARKAEDDALTRLGELAEAVDDTGAAKLQSLVEQLKAIDIGPRSDIRVVIFSERIATLDWLHAMLPELLGLDADKHVRVLHGGLADVKQMDVIEEFGLGDSKVRMLLTGDMASEGVNLHRQCHHLIHFDLPWSLITIEQRNGRIDRYGQEHPPDIRALVVTPDHPRLVGDVRVLSRLLHREDEAHRAFGESGSLLGLHAPDAEEEAIMQALKDGVDADDVIPIKPEKPFDLLTLMSGGTGLDPVAERNPPSLFASDHEFVTEAMASAFADPGTLELRGDSTDPSFLSLTPPKDLVRRLSALPQTYLSEQKVVDRLKVTADHHTANTQLDRARQSEDSQWPEVGFLSPLHPLVDWLVDKVLVGIGRNQAPIIAADVGTPTFCVQGVWSNGRGRPQLVDWLAIGLGTGGDHRIDDLFDVLDAAGVGPRMANPGLASDPLLLQHALPGVVEAARAELDRRRSEHDDRVDELLTGPRDRLEAWVGRSHQLALELEIERRRTEKQRQIDDVEASTARLIESLRTTGSPLVRVLAVLVPKDVRV
ncbi:DEAD/DEAH box helicase [Rhabdothermincola salaria]|uniref:DEAD/DEAH box helicase n=1 Tax=Rhabdothermincola salaria TaxID=2903142 RepID=UPI001E29A662|nr:DEAD/DEAH box helicase [Rhabdothermincola salaria]MCD9625297.1 DEAD/DEAH box helicase [Rhabdothermincola salaria]